MHKQTLTSFTVKFVSGLAKKVALFRIQAIVATAVAAASIAISPFTTGAGAGTTIVILVFSVSPVGTANSKMNGMLCVECKIEI